MMIYTDGSCYKDKVGASAVLYINGLETVSLKHQLGTKQEHTVFEAELVDILLGIHLAKRHLTAWTPINFSIDNQATIKAMQKNKLQPVQYPIDEIHRSTKHLLQLLDEERNQEIRLSSMRAHSSDDPPDSPISFTWIAGHMNSIGNKRADALAKDTSENGSSPKTKLPPFLQKRLPISISAVKQMIQEEIKINCKWWWIESPRY